MTLPAKREQRQLTRRQERQQLARRYPEMAAIVIEAQWQEVTRGLVVHPAPRKPFPLLQALSLLVVSAVAGFFARSLLALPDNTVVAMPPLRPLTGDMVALVGWLIGWVMWLFATYEGLLSVVICALGPLAVIQLFVRWRRGQ
jgi:hypothetical protein